MVTTILVTNPDEMNTALKSASGGDVIVLEARDYGSLKFTSDYADRARGEILFEEEFTFSIG